MSNDGENVLGSSHGGLSIQKKINARIVRPNAFNVFSIKNSNSCSPQNPAKRRHINMLLYSKMSLEEVLLNPFSDDTKCCKTTCSLVISEIRNRAQIKFPEHNAERYKTSDALMVTPIYVPLSRTAINSDCNFMFFVCCPFAS